MLFILPVFPLGSLLFILPVYFLRPASAAVTSVGRLSFFDAVGSRALPHPKVVHMVPYVPSVPYSPSVSCTLYHIHRWYCTTYGTLYVVQSTGNTGQVWNNVWYKWYRGSFWIALCHVPHGFSEVHQALWSPKLLST